MKVKTIGILSILIITMSALLITLPGAMAQTIVAGPGEYWPSFPVLSIIPDEAGVGQEVLMSYGITRQTAWPQAGWTGITIEVTKPDGSTETVGPFMTDTTGLGGAIYVPTMVGTYTFVMYFPEQVVEVEEAGLDVGAIVEASHTPAIELVVGEDPTVTVFPWTALPDEYWVRPVDAQNREWFEVMGSYLDTSYITSMYNRYLPFNDGPQTGHILWEMVQDMGGIAGGDRGWNSHEDGDAYEGKWSTPLIISGIHIGRRYVRGENKVYGVNVRTGEKLWEKTLGEELGLALTPSFGQVFYWDTMNNHGCYSYLWATRGSTWYAFDPLTGRWEYTMENVPGGTRVPGPNGEILRYAMSSRSGTLSVWNSTAAYYDMRLAQLGDDNPLQEYQAGRWRPIGMTFDAGNGTQVETSFPTDLEGGVELVIPLDKAIGSNMEWSGSAPVQDIWIWAVDLRPGREGQLLWNKNWNNPTRGVHYDFAGTHPFSVEHDLFIITGKEERRHYAVSLSTGNDLWSTDAFEPYNQAYSNIYFQYWGQSYCNGDKLITAGFGGVVTAYSLVDGSMLWQYEPGNEFGEFLFGNDWSLVQGLHTDENVYLFHTEHSAIDPKPRGAPSLCLDIETGEEVWRIDGLRLGTRWGGQVVMGDSVILGLSTYDNTIVALGKGPSDISVSIADPTETLGNEVLVQGQIMDVSPGTMAAEQKLRFPDGVPVMSDADMSEWMLYVYKHRPAPMANGVPIRIEAYDPNGNYQDYGTTTSDMEGNFALAIEPEVPGTYWISATFEGSGAFYGDTATTYLVVSEAAEPTTPIQPEPPTPETPLITTEVAIIAAVAVIAVIGVGAFFLLRRRQ